MTEERSRKGEGSGLERGQVMTGGKEGGEKTWVGLGFKISRMMGRGWTPTRLGLRNRGI